MITLRGAALAMLFAGCGNLVDSTGTPGSLQVGKAGGTVKAPGGVSAQVPAGALTQDVLIQVVEVAPPAPLPAGLTLFGHVFAFTPHGETFASPVTLTLPAPADVSDTLVMRLAAPGATQWTQVSESSFSDGSVQVQVTHFSFYAVMQDTNPCEYQSACDPNATCAADGGQAVCTCNNGYSGNGTTCTAVNICPTDNGGCDPHATCAMTGPGTASCTCNPGFVGDGTTCAPYPCNEDNGGCDPNALCSDDGGTRCACDQGYTGDGFTCTPLNCQQDPSICDPNAECIKSVWPECRCKSGFIGDGLQCAVQPCSDDNGGCDPTAACSDTPGSAHCTCDTDAGLYGDGITCGPPCGASPPRTDPKGPSVYCTTADSSCVTYGMPGEPGPGFCICDQGYLGAPGLDGGSCVAWTACSVNNGGCDPHATCLDGGTADAGTFHCVCNLGWQGAPGYFDDGAVCVDIDECDPSFAPGPCDSHATCTNTPGSYACTCNQGYTGDGTTCSPQACSDENGGCDPNATCSLAEGAPHCTCNPGYTGDGITCTKS